MNVTGTLLKVEPRKGGFTNANGEDIAYDFDLLTIWDGSEVVEAKIKADDRVGVPALGLVPGQTVSVVVHAPKGTKFALDVAASAQLRPVKAG